LQNRNSRLAIWERFQVLLMDFCTKTGKVEYCKIRGMNSSKLTPWLFPSIKNIYFLSVFFGVLRMGNDLLNADGDLGHHLALGRLILAEGRIPQTDPFSFRTEGILAIPHEWLTQMLFATLENIFGLSGLVFWSALVIAAAFSVILLDCTRRGGMLITSLVVTSMALAVSTMHWITRPHLFTFLFLAVWSALLYSLLNGKTQKWWIFPLVMVLWANLHGMFVLGLLTLIIGATGYGWERWAEKKPDPAPHLGRNLALAGGTSALATLLTPSGWHLWETIFTLAGSRYITSITSEYRPADFHQPETWTFLLLLGTLIATSLLSPRRMDMPTALLAAGWTLMGLYSARNLPLAALVLAPIAAQSASDWIRASNALAKVQTFSQNLTQLDKLLRGWVLATLGVLLAIGLAAGGTHWDQSGKVYQFLPEKFPVQATEWLRENQREGRMFNEFDWGGYLLMELYPPTQIFMDGHTHIYGDEMSREYMQISTLAPGWEAVMEKYNLRWAIVHRNTPLAAALSERGWQTVYADETAIILER
jgi:hypothetical protein